MLTGRQASRYLLLSPAVAFPYSRIVYPRVSGEPLVHHTAEWTISSTTKTGLERKEAASTGLLVEIARPVFGQRIISMPIRCGPAWGLCANHYAK